MQPAVGHDEAFNFESTPPLTGGRSCTLPRITTVVAAPFTVVVVTAVVVAAFTVVVVAPGEVVPVTTVVATPAGTVVLAPFTVVVVAAFTVVVVAAGTVVEGVGVLKVKALVSVIVTLVLEVNRTLTSTEPEKVTVGEVRVRVAPSDEAITADSVPNHTYTGTLVGKAPDNVRATPPALLAMRGVIESSRH